MSLRAYAASRRDRGLPGGDIKTVREAIAAGRLSQSLTKDGKRIRDAELADQEWAASTKSDYIPLTGPAANVTAPVDNQTSGPATAAPHVNALADARARREAAQAELREMELAKHRGELVPAKDLESHLARIDGHMKATFERCRNKILAIPGRVRQRDPSLTKRQMATIEDLVKDALLELAEGRE
jgi:hypothetical protein